MRNSRDKNCHHLGCGGLVVLATLLVSPESAAQDSSNEPPSTEATAAPAKAAAKAQPPPPKPPPAMPTPALPPEVGAASTPSKPGSATGTAAETAPQPPIVMRRKSEDERIIEMLEFLLLIEMLKDYELFAEDPVKEVKPEGRKEK